MAEAAAWIEVQVACPEGWHELVAEAIRVGPCTTVAFGPSSLGGAPSPKGWTLVRTFYPEREDGPALRASIERALAELGPRAGEPELAGLAPRFRTMPAEDWAISWRKVWKPFRVGRLAVVAPGRGSATRPGDLRLELEPGGVFGTGRHATTRACLGLLCELPLEGSRVLDAGCGTGILAVAAALLGAGECAGFDVDPNAEPYARALAERNGVAGRATFRTGGFELLAGESGRFDLAVANLYADVLVAHAADLARAVRPRGALVLSGIVRHRREALLRAAFATGRSLERELVRGRWHTLLLR